MKAIVYTKYGPPELLQPKEVEKPTPKENQVLVKVLAASANTLEWRRFTLPPILFRFNATLGADIAGRVEAVGRIVTQFQPADEVFGVAAGAFAEYVQPISI